MKGRKIEDQVNQIAPFYQGDLVKATNAIIFCSLKRIKTYLRSTTSQQRLNHLMVLHIHVNLAKDMDLIQVANNMVSKKS